MAATAIEDEPRIAPNVRTLLGALRRRIRQYVWVEGLATAVVWLGVAFWGSLAIDWLFEPPPMVRGVMLALVALVLAGVLVQLIGRRAFVFLSDANMAMLLERRFPKLDDSLLTAVELISHGPSGDGYDSRMLAHTCQEAAERIGEVRLGKVFNPVPLQRSITAAVLLSAAVGMFVVMVPNAFGIWARRSLMLSNELWPRHTRLVVEGFEDGVARVARGADLEVIAKADMNMPVVPQVVQVRYRTEGGARGRATMSREGTARPDRDAFQEYSYTFQGVLADIRFDVVGGDDRVRDLRIEVVESPTIVEMDLLCKFPKYMGHKPRRLPVTGVMQIPLGTQVTVDARANKDLVKVQVDSALEEEPGPPEIHEPNDDDPRTFRYTLDNLALDKTLLFTLFDTDGIKSREPIRLALAAVADEPPELAVQLQGIGSAVTPQARLPAVGQIADDYGVAKVWFEYTVGEQKPGNHPIDSPKGNPTELKLDHALEARDLDLKPGQKMIVSVKAEDRYNLGKDKEPNVGVSERWLLDVVTPEQLRAILEARELVLRQRFELIIHEVTETRDSLSRIDFTRLADTKRNKEEKKETEKKEAAKTAGGEPGSEPGDEPEEESAPSPKRVLALRKLRVQRALQNGRKNAHETLGVADAFDDIRLQLVNNRIDTEELNHRLKDGIADPLRKIAKEMFPELERRLDRLQAVLADEKLGPEHYSRATRQVDTILVQMKQVLGRMIELEDFNEAIALLRTIIEAQGKLGSQTKERHKQKLRELLED